MKVMGKGEGMYGWVGGMDKWALGDVWWVDQLL